MTQEEFDRRTAEAIARWGDPIEREVHRRITIAVAAYAYEIKSTPILSDYSFDKLAQSINPRMGTCHPLLDEFFASKFSPMTGMWIHEHPELPKVAATYRRYYTGVVKEWCERGVAHDKRVAAGRV